MSEKINIQDVDGDPISGRYVLRDGIVIVTASDGRITRGAIEDSMLSPETLAKTLPGRSFTTAIAPNQSGTL
jgi:hypothetical protein